MLKIAWHPIFAHPLPSGHRFPMLKYELIPAQLEHEGTVNTSNFFEPSICNDDIILLTHEENYYSQLIHQTLSAAEIRRIGFPLSPQLIERERMILQGTIDNALYAQQFGVSMNIAGGTHHAYTNRGEGFCLLNDIAVAANYLLQQNLSNKILVVDLDVHQGNGTAQIFKHEQRVFTFSMHGEKNFPAQKEQSDLDIPLKDFTEDKTYLNILETSLPKLIEEVQPDFIFYQSGVDVLESDKLGRLSLSIEGCKQRDKFVLETCKKNKIPLAISMGGGYSEDIKIIVEAHCNTFRLVQEMYF
jgi:acetoin utilization deacetylase AcuC-like enzyme